MTRHSSGRPHRGRSRLRLKPALHFLAGLAVAVIFVLPLYWMVVAALRPPGLPPANTVEWWPAAPHWDNFLEIFRLLPMGRYTTNSLIVVAVGVPITLLTASLAGFALSQLADPWRRRLLIFSVIVLMIPAPAIWLFRFQLLRWMGLLSSLWALIAPAFAAGSPLLVLLFYWTFRRHPVEFYEAAQVEGAGAWTAWRRIAMPLARPTIAAVIVLAFVMYWNDFVGPVLYLYLPKTYTLAVGVQLLKQMDSTNWPLLMAGSAFMTLPVIVLFLVLQRQFLHESALKDIASKAAD